MNSFYPLATTTWDRSEYDAIQRIVSSGNFTMGKEVAHFEERFAEFFGSRFCIMVNSGSSANLLMVAASFYLREPLLHKGDEVIVPAVSWSTTYFPFQQFGLRLKFVDIDIKTLNIDVDKVESAISPNTKAICAVNLLGNACDLERLANICNKHNLLLLEDNCESMGATLSGKYTGTYGKMGSFSSFFSHHISTMEGGMVLTDDEEFYQVMICLRAHGWTRNLPKNNLVSGTKSKNAFEESFRFVLPGYNLRPLELSGAIGSEQLKKLPDLLAGRRRNADYFKLLMCDHPIVSIQQESGDSSWFGFSLVLRENVDRDLVLASLEAAGIEYRPIVAGNFVKNPVIRHIDHVVDGSLEMADYIDRKGFFVGNHHYDIRDQIQVLKNCLDKFVT
jgi:CDP-6-deoxy-D-xylo-4-hexulose-3-dehydrase